MFLSTPAAKDGAAYYVKQLGKTLGSAARFGTKVDSGLRLRHDLMLASANAVAFSEHSRSSSPGFRDDILSLKLTLKS